MAMEKTVRQTVTDVRLVTAAAVVRHLLTGPAIQVALGPVLLDESSRKLDEAKPDNTNSRQGIHADVDSMPSMHGSGV
jgi:hypothetical protein